MSTASKLDVKIISSERVFARNKSKETRHAPLSIIDATVGRFSPTEVIFLYDEPCKENTAPPTGDQLKESLCSTLAAYPQWCGRLRLSDYDPESKSHLDRYGRLVLSYGGDQEPGVEYVIASTTASLASLVPSGKDRAQMQTWNATGFPGKELVPTTLPAEIGLDDPNAPGLVVQITRFSCGGLALAVKMSHPLADAHCLSYLVRDWADVTRAILADKPIPTLAPQFDPQMLDRAAAGDIDSERPDHELIQRARELPFHRHDWWTSAAECPFPTKSKEIPEVLRDQPHDEPGEQMPWHTWDMAAPVQHILIHFSGQEMAAMQKACRTMEPKASKQDAIVAHVWNCVNRARGLGEDDEPIWLDYTLGLRSRTNPPLGERFVGSPILLVAVQASGRGASHGDAIAHLAGLVRQTTAMITQEALAAHLHDKLYEQCPQRLWQTFLGRRHLLTTSWIHTNLYDVDFGFGSPRYVEPVMPKIDGLFQLMEAKPVGTWQVTNPAQSWSDCGIDCHLYLEEAAAAKLLSDPSLRRFL